MAWPIEVAALDVAAVASGRRGAHPAIVCAFPPGLRATIHNVSVSLNAQQYSSYTPATPEDVLWWPPTAVPLDIYPAPIQSSISPSSGPVDGGTVVRVSGANLGGGHNYTCRFGDGRPQPEFTNNSRSYLPAFDVPALQGVHAPSRRADEAAGVDETAVVCVSPRRSLATCGVEGHETDSEYRAPSESVSCTPHPNLTAPLAVAPNGQDYTDGDETSYATDGRSGALRRFGFVHYATPILSGLSPATGPAAGETLVTVSGLHLHSGSDYRCDFGAIGGAPPRRDDRIVNATLDWSSKDGVVRCFAPPLPELASRASAFQLSLNGQQFHNASTVSFARYASPHVASISPGLGPTAGGTNVTLAAPALGVLSGGSHYVCRFRHADAAAAADCAGQARDAANRSRYSGATVGDACDGQRVPAYEAADGAAVWCVAPPGAEGPLRLDLALNGQQFVDGAAGAPHLFHRHAPPLLLSLSPALGPVGGDTLVRVAANASLHNVEREDTVCKFGDVWVNGSADDRGGMLCRSPPGVTTAALELSLNAQQFTTARLQFLAYQPPGPTELLPPIGPAAGATSILVLGSNLSAHAQPTPSTEPAPSMPWPGIRRSAGEATTAKAAYACATCAGGAPPARATLRITMKTPAWKVEPQSAIAGATPRDSPPPPPNTKAGRATRVTPTKARAIAAPSKRPSRSRRTARPRSAAHAGEVKKMAVASPTSMAPKE